MSQHTVRTDHGLHNPERRSHIQRIADEMGCCWWDIAIENRDFFWMKTTTYGSELLPLQAGRLNTA
jgi:hypothetical protein